MAEIHDPDKKQLKEEGVCLSDRFRVESPPCAEDINRQELAGDVVHTQEEEGIGNGLAKNPRSPHTAMYVLQLQLQSSQTAPPTETKCPPHLFKHIHRVLRFPFPLSSLL